MLVAAWKFRHGIPGKQYDHLSRFKTLHFFSSMHSSWVVVWIRDSPSCAIAMAIFASVTVSMGDGQRYLSQCYGRLQHDTGGSERDLAE